MHLKKGVILACCSLLIFGSALFVSANATAEKFTPRAPIRINGNNGFIAANGVVGGNGSETNPYIIEGWEINASGYGFGIFIGNTTEHFIIRNCYIHHASGNSGDFTKNSGIYLYNVLNGKVENCTISCNGIGIYAVFSSGCRITGNTINQSVDAGVQVYFSDTLTISSNLISNTSYGILMDSSTGCSIGGNTFSNCGVVLRGEILEYWNSHTISTTNTVNGKALYYYKDMSSVAVPSAGQIILANCTGFSVKNQVISGTSTALLAGFTKNTTIENCNFSSNRFYGIEFYACDGNTVNSTNATQNGISGIALTKSNWNRFNTVTVDANQDTGILLTNSNNNTLNQIKASSNRNKGINIVQSQNNYILNSQVNRNQDDGISCVYSYRITVYNCTTNGNGRYGISITYSDDNNLVSCNASNCSVGIRLYAANHNKISSNTALNCSVGINLYSCSNNQITSNLLKNNTQGLLLFYSDSNTISTNTFSTNSVGLHLEYSNTNLVTANEFLANSIFGVNITPGSTGNRIHGNNFIGNGNINRQSADNGIANYWNTSSAGNFWDEWTSPDANQDGIVDNPYTINGSGGAKDYYPLTTRAPFIQILHTPLGIGYINQQISIVAEIRSIYNLTEARVYYQPVGSSSWYALTMIRTSGNSTHGIYQATIPSQDSLGTLKYNITATDERGTKAQTPVYQLEITSPTPEITGIVILIVCTAILLLRRNSEF